MTRSCPNAYIVTYEVLKQSEDNRLLIPIFDEVESTQQRQLYAWSAADAVLQFELWAKQEKVRLVQHNRANKVGSLWARQVRLIDLVPARVQQHGDKEVWLLMRPGGESSIWDP